MNVSLNFMVADALAAKHPHIAELVHKEAVRQATNIELIASENYPSEDVMIASSSCFMNKYAEGYPDYERTGNRGRYYGGCENVDALEQGCCEAWQKAFHTDYHVNVQPASGSHANMASYQAVLDLGDTILSMDVNDGGHLTHSSQASFVKRNYNVIAYGVDENGFINMNTVRDLAIHYKPKLIVAGASAYSRFINYEKFKEIADEVGAYFMVDMAHVSGLIATGEHPSPFGYADIITTTCQKIARGPRGAIIFCKLELAKKIDSAIFPGTAGGPAENIICAKYVCAEEMDTQEYADYTKRVVANAKAMADEFIKLGFKVITGGTDNHMLLLDLRQNYPDITGKEVQDLLVTKGVTLNMNRVPGDERGPKKTSGVRIGTPAMTTLGWTEEEFRQTAQYIAEQIEEYSKTKK